MDRPPREILQKIPRHIENSRLMKHFAQDLVLWAGLGWGARSGRGIFISAALALGFAIFCFRSFALMHEAVHSAAATSRRWNRVAGCFYGIFCFLPFASWREVHLHHHMWTGNVEKDPSTRLIYNFKANGYQTSSYVEWSWKNWIPLLALMQHVVFWRATKSKAEGVYVALSVAFLGLSAWALGPATLLAGLIIYLYMVEIINFPHHLSLEQFEGEARFSPHEQARFTRTCVYPKWFAHLVLLNFNLHTEHHLFPAHPWYALDQLHAELSERKMILNQCTSNEWILKNRARPIGEVFAETFPEKSRKNVA